MGLDAFSAWTHEVRPPDISGFEYARSVITNPIPASVATAPTRKTDGYPARAASTPVIGPDIPYAISWNATNPPNAVTRLCGGMCSAGADVVTRATTPITRQRFLE